jgi:hypothetical protein
MTGGALKPEPDRKQRPELGGDSGAIMGLLGLSSRPTPLSPI